MSRLSAPNHSFGANALKALAFFVLGVAASLAAAALAVLLTYAVWGASFISGFEGLVFTLVLWAVVLRLPAVASSYLARLSFHAGRLLGLLIAGVIGIRWLFSGGGTSALSRVARVSGLTEILGRYANMGRHLSPDGTLPTLGYTLLVGGVVGIALLAALAPFLLLAISVARGITDGAREGRENGEKADHEEPGRTKRRHRIAKRGRGGS